jgi:dCTP deaminase
VILTGPEIAEQVKRERITILPFSVDQVNPNSYDFRLGHTVMGYRNATLDVSEVQPTWTAEMDDEGFIFRPGRIYLAHTLEVMGSCNYVPIIRAKSSVARLGLFIHVTADLIDIGSVNQWTLQLHAVQPVRLYPKMRIGQVTFWTVQGEISLYDGKYQGTRGPAASRIHEEFKATRPAQNGDQAS